MVPSFKIFTIITLCGFFQSCPAQSLWENVPWTVIGDSSQLNQNPSVSITGKIQIKGSGEPVTGASISADLFKYFDYSDQFGKYYVELPRGKYKIAVRHVGMKPLYFRIRVVSNGILDMEMEEGSISLDEVIISSRPIDSNVKESLSGLTILDVQEVKTLPTLMGE